MPRDLLAYIPSVGHDTTDEFSELHQIDDISCNLLEVIDSEVSSSSKSLAVRSLDSIKVLPFVPHEVKDGTI